MVCRPSVPQIEVEVAANAKAVQGIGEEDPLVLHLKTKNKHVTFFPFLAVFSGRHLQNPTGESCIVLVVVATKQVTHAKVVDDVRCGSGRVLQYG